MICLCIILSSWFPITCQEPVTGNGGIICKAAAAGQILYRLTEPGEIISLLGTPRNKTARKDGGMDIMVLEYAGVNLTFGRQRNEEAVPFTLRRCTVNGKELDIGRGKKLVLRSNADLCKLDSFRGFQDIGLQHTDLRTNADLVSRMRFDTNTEWPCKKFLPSGFDPDALIESGKNPGLGIRALHDQGITGKGVGIAVFDQPLLLGHIEYTGRIARYDETGLCGMPPQMHGSPIASIAVGASTGVAPGAELSYFAVPMWEKDNACYVKTLGKVMDLNKDLPPDERIRVVSISDGSFSRKKHYEEWKTIVAAAEASGITVITCDTSRITFGTLTLQPGEDPDLPSSYNKGKYCFDFDDIRVPTGNKTIASHRGDSVYTFEREGGRSWASPYVAGLAAMALQINPGLKPGEIFCLLTETAAKTAAGPVINPREFIKGVQQHNKNPAK